MRGRGLLLALCVTCMSPSGVGVAHAAAATPAPKAGISMAGAGGKQTVRYGERVAISGFVGPRVGGRPVSLEYARRGQAFKAVATATTKADGSYRFTVRARRSGSYRTLARDVAAATAARNVTVVAHLTTRSRRHVLGGRRLVVAGHLLPRLAGRRLRLQVRRNHRWKTIDTTRTHTGGRFRASFKPSGPGVYRLRVRFAGDASAAAASARLKRVYVYRPSQASWYGPGLFGNATACGGTLSVGRLGVANKYLPCGTRVTFRYRGRSVTVPVIDRGPFSSGREWDLTAATKQRLRFGDVGVVWATR
jgi:rare lipoprotein A